MPTGQAISGTDGRVMINGMVLYLDHWEVDPTAGDIKTTNFESQGYEDGQTGVKVAAVKFSGYWDLNNNPHANPPNLLAGQILSNVRVYTSLTNNLYFSFPLFRVLGVPVNNAVEERVNVSVSGKSKGVWYYPGNIQA